MQFLYLDIALSYTYDFPIEAPDELSVISSQTAHEISTLAAHELHLPLKTPDDGCYARSHKISHYLSEKLGITTAKLFIAGKLEFYSIYLPKGYQKWKYHAVTVVAVENRHSGGVTLFAIEPLISDKPVPINILVNGLLRENAPEPELTLAPMFVFIPDDVNKGISHFREGDLAEMSLDLNKFHRMYTMRSRDHEYPYVKNPN